MKITQIEKRAREFFASMEKECEKYDGMEVTIQHGQYKGRKGIVKNSQLNNGCELIAMIQPIRLAGGPPEDLLWDRADARTFWPLCDVPELQGE
jgi:hypothetical protein